MMSSMVRIQEEELSDVVIYTKSWCGHCMKAKGLLRRRGVANWTEFDIEALPEKRREMIQRAGGRTSVPQIFVDGEYVGGSTELHNLDYAERRGTVEPTVVEAFDVEQGAVPTPGHMAAVASFRHIVRAELTDHAHASRCCSNERWCRRQHRVERLDHVHDAPQGGQTSNSVVAERSSLGRVLPSEYASPPVGGCGR